MPTYKDPSTKPHPDSFDALPLSAGVDGYLGLWGVVGGKSSSTFRITRTGRRSVFGGCKGRPSFLSVRFSPGFELSRTFPLPGFPPQCVVLKVVDAKKFALPSAVLRAWWKSPRGSSSRSVQEKV